MSGCEKHYVRTQLRSLLPFAYERLLIEDSKMNYYFSVNLWFLEVTSNFAKNISFGYKM